MIASKVRKTSIMKLDIRNKLLCTWLTAVRSVKNPEAKNGKIYQSSRAVWTGRILFLSCLVAVAAALGVLANFFLSRSEDELAVTQYQSIVDRALVTSKEIVVRKDLGAVSMASVMAVAFPNASVWPYVALNGYEYIANNIIATSNGRDLAVCPIVYPEKIPSFEAFAKNYYTKYRMPPFPNNTGKLAGVSSFGFGIFGIDTTLPNTTDQRYHATDGTTNYGSPYNMVLPILQHSAGLRHPVLLLDIHFEKTRGQVIDGIIDCAAKRAMASMNDENKTAYKVISCGGITDTLQLASSSKNTPGALILQPIYPYYDDTTITGIISSSIVWEESLLNCFSSEVSGIDCVLSTEDTKYTYRIDKGLATLRGEGDLHDTGYDRYSRSICVTCDGVFNEEFSTRYNITFYPTEEFFNIYSTNNPRVATIGAILIIIFTSLLFILYDYFVRREFQSKKDLLKAKRQFMRFVSHEVRTPLNSVNMGLVLLQEEIEVARRHQVRMEQAAICAVDKADESSAGRDCATEGKMKDVVDDALASKDGTDRMSLVNHNKPVTADTIVDWLALTSEIYDNSQAAVAVLSDLLNYDKIETGTLHLELSILSLWTLLQQTANEFKVAAAHKKIQYEALLNPVTAISSDVEINSISPAVTKTASVTASGITVDTGTVDSDSVAGDVERACSATDYDASQYMTVGDSVRLCQCIRNLISNALKFTPENGKVTIRAACMKLDTNVKFRSKKDYIPLVETFVLAKGEQVSYTRSGALEITITDSGAGLTKDQLNRLFRDGVQFNVNELQGGNGTGLGLHITKGIIEQHKGSITASSDGLGYGTTFGVTLPIYDIPIRLMNERMRNSALQVSSVTIKNPADLSDCTVEAVQLRILIVDDATTNRKLLRRLLQNHGHICDEAPDGDVAVRLVQEHMITSNAFYDTILIDHEMPVMDGPTSVKHMRDLGCQSFIVGVTGNVLPEDIAVFKRSGANNVLPKPFYLNDLMNLWVENGLVERQTTET